MLMCCADVTPSLDSVCNNILQGLGWSCASTCWLRDFCAWCGTWLLCDTYLINVPVPCRKPNARVELPKKKYSPLAGPILNYFVLLQKARFSSLYLMTKVQAVGSMAAPAGDLFKLDVVSRVAYWWLRSKLGM